MASKSAPLSVEFNSKLEEGSVISRPHEDLRRHTATDHRTGGPVVSFAPASWWAIAVAHVAVERAPAGVASYETLVEQARTSAVKAREAAILESHNHRRVIALLRLDGHEAFRHLTAAWDDRHLLAQRHAVDESHSLALYRLAAAAGEAAFDPLSTDVYAFEHAARAAAASGSVIAAITAAPGFRGVAIFDADGSTGSAILYRFAHVEEIEPFRATSDAFDQVRPVRTFASENV
jgi:hypothetical protein